MFHLFRTNNGILTMMIALLLMGQTPEFMDIVKTPFTHATIC